MQFPSLLPFPLADYEIVLIPQLDLMKELNTLVLSGNPIREIGVSLVKVEINYKAELARNSKVQNLDLGNNLITNWSDLKVKKLVPNLQIFNARLMDKIMKNEKGDIVDDSLLNFANKLGVEKEELIDHSMRNKNSKHYEMNQSKDGQLNSAGGLDMEKKLKHKNRKQWNSRKKIQSSRRIVPSLRRN
ncbi:hypothetical protein F0562_023010 [Nyssa sinensis]|uniref:Uncharacterized protein n=1 Tax=Nyssa sinensis TaxID=561372 RepID=A0A5J5BGV4_9ASTE|nr:hypothetical protein F0562_023010 [Nyssa sinensis]